MSAPISPGPAPLVAVNDTNRFAIGSLTYTKAGLITLFLFPRWGDFSFTLMETVVPSILPLKFKAIGAGINPWISFRSDPALP